MVCNKITSKSKIEDCFSTKHPVTLKPHLQHKVSKTCIIKDMKRDLVSQIIKDKVLLKWCFIILACEAAKVCKVTTLVKDPATYI